MTVLSWPIELLTENFSSVSPSVSHEDGDGYPAVAVLEALNNDVFRGKEVAENRQSEGGGALSLGLPVAVLEVPVEWEDLFCQKCLERKRFVAEFLAPNGLLGCCTACGVERVIPFSRENSV